MKNIKFIIEYDGTGFVGWQFQKNGRSVQEEIEKALHSLLQEDVRIIGAGRTDAGVHARGQVANFKTGTRLSCSEINRGMNAHLPEEIVIRSVEEVDADFHAQYSAKARSYRYVILTTKSAIERNYGWQLNYELDLMAMQRCSETILGDHDFQSFCRNIAESEHYRCIVMLSNWTGFDNRLYYDITANRFLHGMVRGLVGTMVDVGRKYRTVEEFERILHGKDRSLGGMAAPAKGLFLEKITY